MDPQQQQKTSKKTPRSSSTPSKAVTFADVARKKKKKDRSNSAGNQKMIPEMNSGGKQIGIMNNNSNSTSQLDTAQQQQLPSIRHQKDTATADGHMMHEMLSTFSPTEYNCFQSYQRASFSASVIEPYIAACIEQRYNISRQRRRKGESTTQANVHSNQLNAGMEREGSETMSVAAKLEDYVATPSQASEIGLIVAIAAKIYAQRLIAEAVDVQKREQQKLKQQLSEVTTMIDQNTTDDAMDTSSSPTAATAASKNSSNQRLHFKNNASSNSSVLLCTSVYKAVQDRQSRGVDPGFFISNTNINSNNHQYHDYSITNTTSHNLYDVRRLAAMTVVAKTKKSADANSSTAETMKTNNR